MLTVQSTNKEDENKDEDEHLPWSSAWLADLSLDISDEAVSLDLATSGVLQCLAALTFVKMKIKTNKTNWNTIKPMASASSGGCRCSWRQGGAPKVTW